MYILTAIFTAMLILTLALVGLEGWLASEFGLFLSYDILSPELLSITAMVLIATLFVSIFPGFEAYKNALHAQLSGH